ncbi:MAG: hemerythrin domain-containing protein [Elusimicrobia bacterium]|nr:hemerythrin domain-containing protein [Elusimicrobiota bacterium]
MSLFASLSREHALLLRVVGRLERCAADPNPRVAERETRGALLVLLNALALHERLEDKIFEAAPEAPAPAADQARRLVADQHAALARLREKIRGLLAQACGEDPAVLREAALDLARFLRRHFLAEERDLWPHFNACAGRSALRRLSRQAQEQLRSMTREVDLYWTALDDCMAGLR